MLHNFKSLIREAHKNNYAIPAFNVHNLIDILAVVNKCKELRSPVILACTPSTFTFAGIKNIIAISEELSKDSGIPIVLHMDHHHIVEDIKKGVDYGIKSVMIDSSQKEIKDNIADTNEVTDYIKGKGVSIEAELGIIPGVEDDLVVIQEKNKNYYTKIEEIDRFIKETNIDALALAIGNAHGMYIKKPSLNFELLKKIHYKYPDMPLVLHGASGLAKKQMIESLQYGISKINVGTELKVEFAKSLRKFLENNPKQDDPRYFYEEPMKAVGKVVEYIVDICKSRNKA